MKKIKVPSTIKFEEMIDDGCVEEINTAFEIYTDKDDVLSFITNKHIVYLNKKEVEKCYKIFEIDYDIQHNDVLNKDDWIEEYSDSFANRVIKEMNVKHIPFWFSPLVNEGYYNYLKSAESKSKDYETSLEPLIKQYWCDPSKKNSGYVLNSYGNNVTLEDGTTHIVDYKDILDVLMSPMNVTLDWLIDHPEFDKDYYLNNINGFYIDYNGFSIYINGKSTIYINDYLVPNNSPHLLLEYEDDLEFIDNCWVEMINKSNPNEEFDVYGSFKEAKEYIDTLKE